MSDCLPESIWRDLLGRPYAEDARGPEQFDCVGLFLEIQRRLGRAVPPYPSDPMLVPAARKQWERVETPAPGDAVLIVSHDPPWHIAVVLETEPQPWMLHSNSAMGVVRSRMDRFPWRNQIEGYYRWQPL